jgi:hypothetical protein
MLLKSCYSWDILTKIRKIGLAVREGYFLGFWLEVLGEDEAGEAVGGLFRDWEGYCNEGIESDWLFQAAGASNFWFVLSNHQVSNNWLVSFCVGQPALCCHDAVCSVIAIDRVDLWLGLNSV